MKIFRFTVFILISYSLTVNCGNKLNFDFDYAYFKAENTKLYLEIYYAFNQEELIFIKTKDGFEAGGKLMLDIYSNSLKRNVLMNDYNIPLILKDTAGYDRHAKLTGQIVYLIDSGSYKLNIKACDLHDTTNCFDVSENIDLKPINAAILNSSSIQLSSGIKKSSDESSLFYKNTLEVTPNPSNLFGNNISEVYYYIEMYNLRKDLLSESYFVQISITDTEGKEIKSQIKNYKIITDTKVEHGAIDIKEIPTGKYILFIKVLNDQNAELLNAFKIFYIFNSSVVVDNQNVTDLDKRYLTSEYPKMTEKQVNDEFEKTIYIMTDKNRKNFESLNDLDAKRKFMFAFWDALDPNKLTPDSEFKKEYFNKIDFANRSFKSDFREGWKTDRGRIYCLYGKYDEIERHSYEGATRAYEIWTYNSLQGGVIFVFIDKSAGYSDYELVHSNAQYEINNENWRDKLLIK
ncbi:MAG TPA: GWxTD domain-containing protein [Ignavibacteria bacterium]|nr:GWxTD domain-containing protein [Ignavibacteria bacterium]